MSQAISKSLQIMRTSPIIPVLAIDNLDYAVPLAKALVAGGLRVLEITLRTDCALAVMRAIADHVPNAIVGAGTMAKPEHFQQVIDAGCVFGISPGLPQALIDEHKKHPDFAFLPGVMTPTELMTAKLAGYTEVKLFPAMQAGGIGMLKALGGPFPDVSFCPTGGITPETASQFLALPNVACVGGSWFAPKDLMAAGKWDEIQKLAEAAAALAK